MRAARIPCPQVYTFDARGVSGHPNHIAVHHGVRAWRRARRDPGQQPVRVFTLDSVGLLRCASSSAYYACEPRGEQTAGRGGSANRSRARRRKYTAALDAGWCLVTRAAGWTTDVHTFLSWHSGPENRRALLAHKSQMVW